MHLRVVYLDSVGDSMTRVALISLAVLTMIACGETSDGGDRNGTGGNGGFAGMPGSGGMTGEGGNGGSGGPPTDAEAVCDLVIGTDCGLGNFETSCPSEVPTGCDAASLLTALGGFSANDPEICTVASQECPDVIATACAALDPICAAEGLTPYVDNVDCLASFDEPTCPTFIPQGLLDGLVTCHEVLQSSCGSVSQKSTACGFLQSGANGPPCYGSQQACETVIAGQSTSLYGALISGFADCDYLKNTLGLIE